MTDYKQLIIAFLGTTVLIAGLASFVAYRNGELDRLNKADTFANVPVPLAPTKENEQISTTSKPQATTTPNTNTSMHNPIVILKTTKGDISIELALDKMPITASNFLKLAKSGFYDNTKFHRVIDGFMIQGGDPKSKAEDTSKYGTGGPEYVIKDEFVQGQSNVRGTIAMANSGPDTGGSQFFINTVDNTYLDFDKSNAGKHPVFGQVVAGMDVVDAISKVAVDPHKLPLDPVIVKSVEVKE